MRSPDSSIPAEEHLFRSASPADLRDGTALLPEWLSLPSVSCNRSAYSEPGSVLTKERPNDTYVAEITVGDIPGPIRSPDGATTYQWSAVDDPLGPCDRGGPNDAHAEIRLLRNGTYDPKRKPNSPAFKLKVRDALVTKFRLIQIQKITEAEKDPPNAGTLAEAPAAAPTGT